MVKVVLLDDDHDLLEMVCMMLNTPQITPVCFEDCKEVLPVLSKVNPDVLVMDIFLGACDGRSLCKQIKGMKNHSNLPVLLYSAGEIMPETIEDCGADGFLRKPFEMDDLIDKVLNLADKRA